MILLARQEREPANGCTAAAWSSNRGIGGRARQGAGRRDRARPRRSRRARRRWGSSGQRGAGRPPRCRAGGVRERGAARRCRQGGHLPRDRAELRRGSCATRAAASTPRPSPRTATASCTPSEGGSSAAAAGPGWRGAGRRHGVGTGGPAVNAVGTAPPRVFVVDDHALFRAGCGPSSAGGSRSSATPGTWTTPSPGSSPASQTSSSSTSTCPVAAAGPSWKRCGTGLRTSARASVSDAAEDVLGLISRRTATSPRRSPATSSSTPSSAAERRRGVLAPPGRLRARRLRRRPSLVDPEMDQLTPREREVLRLIARGYSYKEMASRLHLSVKTVETHVVGAPQAAALQPPRADHVGRGPPLALTNRLP